LPFFVSGLYGFQFVLLEFWRLWFFLLTLGAFGLFLCHLSQVALGIANGMAEALGNSLVVSLLSWVFVGKSTFLQILPLPSLSNSSSVPLIDELANVKVRGALEFLRFIKSFSRAQAGVGCVGAVLFLGRILSSWV
jgi:hypothetical protein